MVVDGGSLTVCNLWVSYVFSIFGYVFLSSVYRGGFVCVGPPETLLVRVCMHIYCKERDID